MAVPVKHPKGLLDRPTARHTAADTPHTSRLVCWIAVVGGSLFAHDRPRTSRTASDCYRLVQSAPRRMRPSGLYCTHSIPIPGSQIPSPNPKSQILNFIPKLYPLSLNFIPKLYP